MTGMGDDARRGAGDHTLHLLVASGVVVVVTALLAARDRLLVGEAGAVEALNGSVVLRFPAINAALIAIMVFGTLVGVVVAAAGAALLTKRWQPAGALVLAGILGWIVSKLLKAIVGRGRPVEFLDVRTLHLHGRYASITGAGYPSGHTCVAFALATVVAAWIPARHRWVPWVVATLVGIARIYVAAHFPLDVIGGAALGIVLGCLVNLAYPVAAPPAADEAPDRAAGPTG